MADDSRKKAIDKLLGGRSEMARGKQVSPQSPPGFYVKSRRTQIEREKK